MHTRRAWQVLLLGALLALPTPARAEPEVWLVMSPIASEDGPPDDVPDAAFTSEAGAIALREGDVVPMPACDASLHFGLRPSSDAPLHQQIVVRLLKRHTASTCALDVLTVTTRPQSASEKAQAASTGSPTGSNRRDETPRDRPCGTTLIALSEGRTRGVSSRSMAGTGPNGDCPAGSDELPNGLGVQWLPTNH